jgi:hypothetical protein
MLDLRRDFFGGSTGVQAGEPERQTWALVSVNNELIREIRR